MSQPNVDQVSGTYFRKGACVVCGKQAERTRTITAEFHTWREAVLQAFDYADLFTTASKPRVRWMDDCWVLTYTYRPRPLMHKKCELKYLGEDLPW